MIVASMQAVEAGTIADATTSVLSGQSYSVDSFIRVTGTVKTMPEAVSSALYDWYTENNAYLQQMVDGTFMK